MKRDLLRVTRSAGQSYVQQWVEEKRGYYLVVACSRGQSEDHNRVIRTIVAEISEGLVLTKRQAVQRRDELIGVARVLRVARRSASSLKRPAGCLA